MVQIYNEITIYFYKAVFSSRAPLPPDPPARGIGPPDPAEGVPSALPHVEECTYFWGVNTSWGRNTAESKDLWIRKIIRLHNQQKYGTWRMCVDYRDLNKITTKNRYLIPRIDDLLDQLKNDVYFTKLDLNNGYHQIKVAEQCWGKDIKWSYSSIFGSYLAK